MPSQTAFRGPTARPAADPSVTTGPPPGTTASLRVNTHLSTASEPLWEGKGFRETSVHVYRVRQRKDKV